MSDEESVEGKEPKKVKFIISTPPKREKTLEEKAKMINWEAVDKMANRKKWIKG